MIVCIFSKPLIKIICSLLAFVLFNIIKCLTFSQGNIQDDLKSKCFICDLQAHEFDRKA